MKVKNLIIACLVALFLRHFFIEGTENEITDYLSLLLVLIIYLVYQVEDFTDKLNKYFPEDPVYEVPPEIPMEPERKETINGHKIHEYYWAGDFVIYIDNYLFNGTWEDAIKACGGKPDG